MKPSFFLVKKGNSAIFMMVDQTKLICRGVLSVLIGSKLSIPLQERWIR